jgi:hypothetical protein
MEEVQCWKYGLGVAKTGPYMKCYPKIRGMPTVAKLRRCVIKFIEFL